MKKIVACAFVVMLMAGAGCEGGGDASCALCMTSLSTSDCARIAAAHGCTSSETYVDPMCGTASVIGCQFHGCPAGPVMCTTTPDAGGGSDSGAAADAGR